MSISKSLLAVCFSFAVGAFCFGSKASSQGGAGQAASSNSNAAFISRSPILQIPPFVDASKALARLSLLDYESARFQDVRLLILQMPVKVSENSTETTKIPTLYFCGKVNGKNQFGAYAGFSDFVVVPEQSLFSLSDPSERVKILEDLSSYSWLSLCNASDRRYGNNIDYSSWFQASIR